jgi:hypothetical protein
MAVVAPLPVWGGDAVVANEPTGIKAAAQFTKEDQCTSIAWYFTNDAPLRERQVAQTVQVGESGRAKAIALKLSTEALSGLGDNATYELKVYESSERPDNVFIQRSPVLTQEGVVRGGDGKWLIFNFDEELPLTESNFYTFSFTFTDMSSGNKVVLVQSPGESAAFRWHRADRGSWVPSTQSLHFLLY